MSVLKFTPDKKHTETILLCKIRGKYQKCDRSCIFRRGNGKQTSVW